MGFFKKIGKAIGGAVKKVASGKAFGIALGILNPTALLANANILQKLGVKVPFANVLVPLSSIGQKAVLGMLSGGSLAGLAGAGGLAGNSGNLLQLAQKFMPMVSQLAGDPQAQQLQQSQQAQGADPGEMLRQNIMNSIAQSHAQLFFT